MDGSYNQEVVHRPPQNMRGPRGYKPFKNPPQPHMCIQDSIRGTTEKLYINVMSWKQIANTKQCADLIPLYGGMQILHGCAPNCNRPPLNIFAVMVNPEILKINGKNSTNPQERDALVSLLCDFVEAMNPGLFLTKKPTILKDRDLAGELKDVWHAVQAHREKEKIKNQELNSDVTHKIYHIDGPETSPKPFVDNNQTNSSKDIAKSPVSSSDNNLKNEVLVLGENANNSFISNNSRTDIPVLKTPDHTKNVNNLESLTSTINNHIDAAVLRQENVIPNLASKENLSTQNFHENNEPGTNFNHTEYSSPKYDKLKQVTTKHQAPVNKANSKKKISKQKSNPDNLVQPNDTNRFISSKTEIREINTNSGAMQHDISENVINTFNSISLNDNKQLNTSIQTYSNLQNQSAPVLSAAVNFDNKKDIPFVDDYHDKIDDPSICKMDKVEILENHIINPIQQPVKNVDTSISNVNDQNKVSLSSQ